MFNTDDLYRILSRIDGAGYKAYKEIQQSYLCEHDILHIDHVQGDPYAAPSRLRFSVSINQAGFPAYLFEGVRKIALEDILTRVVNKNIKMLEKRHRGTGKSGLISIDCGGQEVMRRTAVRIKADHVEARMSLGLPADGRRIRGREACELINDVIYVARKSLYFEHLDEKVLREFVYLFEDQENIREQLRNMGLVAFVGNGSILPRRSGNSSLPMDDSKCVKFISPSEMEVKINTIHHGQLKGMGVPAGITLITGGGYHGKSTLLKALEQGVYNHIGGDGREWVITSEDAVKIRAEDGRSVRKVNIRYFIDNLPFGQDTESFSTVNASGSTSQAANIIEAIEAGSRLLLLDEDTSATNFMIRDARMQELISSDKEPITPFVDRILPLYKDKGISTILVIGGAGDYLDVATRVIMMDSYRVYDCTVRAKEIAKAIRTGRKKEGRGQQTINNDRIVETSSFSMLSQERARVSARGIDEVVLSKEVIDLHAVEQLVDESQTRSIAAALRYMVRYINGRRYIEQLLDMLYRDLEEDMDCISPFRQGQHPGDMAWPRRYEVAAAINRLRTLIIK